MAVQVPCTCPMEPHPPRCSPAPSPRGVICAGVSQPSSYGALSDRVLGNTRLSSSTVAAIPISIAVQNEACPQCSTPIDRTVRKCVLAKLELTRPGSGSGVVLTTPALTEIPSVWRMRCVRLCLTTFLALLAFSTLNRLTITMCEPPSLNFIEGHLVEGDCLYRVR